MFEIIVVALIVLAAITALVVVSSIFLAYATQANYVDENYSNDDD